MYYNTDPYIEHYGILGMKLASNERYIALQKKKASEYKPTEAQKAQVNVLIERLNKL